jgi:hypothetical protein
MSGKQFYKTETFWAVFLGIIGCMALFWNLITNPTDWPNILVNFSQIGVTVIVFFLAKGLIGKDFNEKFENYLIEWADQNEYLIDARNIKKERGKEKKRTIEMIVDHENILRGDSIDSKEKGAFLYLPSKKDIRSEQILKFKINKSMFKHKANFDYEAEKNNLLEKLAKRIEDQFEDLGIKSFKSTEPEKIEVDFSGLDKTEENAKKLIDIVEFVKTLFLAIA